MPSRTASFFHLHLVSDSTGETLITVARAAAAQYATVHPVEHVYPAVRTNKQLDRVLAEIETEIAKLTRRAARKAARKAEQAQRDAFVHGVPSLTDEP